MREREQRRERDGERLRVDEGDGQRAGERGERERDGERAARRLHGNEARRECDGNHGSRGFLSRTDLSVPLSAPSSSSCSPRSSYGPLLFAHGSSHEHRRIRKERERERKVERAHNRVGPRVGCALSPRKLLRFLFALFLRPRSFSPPFLSRRQSR